MIYNVSELLEMTNEGRNTFHTKLNFAAYVCAQKLIPSQI